jgi:hypothetical protein
MHAKHPKLAKEFEEATPKDKKLPEHVKGSKSPVAKAKTKAGKTIVKAKVKAKNAQESAIDPTKLLPRKIERDVLEYVQATKPCRVDRDKGIIYGCKLVGLQSKNGGRYTLEGLREAAPMFEGAKCNLNHPDRDKPGKDRDVQDRFGIFHNYMVGDDGAYADLHYLKSHPFAAVACEAAENPQLETALGFSQNARTIQVPDGNGGIIHESITRVRSVDLVADPATTCSIFESENQAMNDPHTQGMAGDDVVPDATTDTAAAIEQDPVDIAIDALLGKYLPDIKAADKAGRKPLLNDLRKKIDAIIDALSEEPEKAETTTEGSETEGEEKSTEESVKEEKTVEKSKTTEQKVKPDYEQALDVLESAKVQPTSIRIKALLALPAEDRSALAESWPKIGATTEQKVKPKSSSVLESFKDKDEKAATLPFPTAEQLKDDAMLLMAGAR